MRLPEWFCDRYRGKRGFFGWLVQREDLWWLREIVRKAKSL